MEEGGEDFVGQESWGEGWGGRLDVPGGLTRQWSHSQVLAGDYT